MDITQSSLYKEFGKLSQNSEKSVQSGRALSDLDSYLHVERPVEALLRSKMTEVDRANGGIVLLIGSAGDGKSHLLSRVRADYDWGEGSFYNDATASCSPSKTAVETLKEALSEFRDERIGTTTSKLVLAINLGKLNAFIEDPEVRQQYSKIVSATAGIFDDDDTTDEEETDKIKIVLFAKEQMFELITGTSDPYPVKSDFLSSILDKIVSPSDNNPFWKAYQKDKINEDASDTPVLINYELLKSEAVRNAIVKTIIEAIVRFKLIITPREFLDFVFSIIVYKGFDHYNEKEDYYKCLMPSLLYSGGSNLILKSIARLDPTIYSNTDHDKKLAFLFTSYSIPPEMESAMCATGVPETVIERVNSFYKNNGRNLDATTQFVFLLCHILDYHSESQVYSGFIGLLPKILMQDSDAMSKIYEIVGRALPRHFGSFYGKPNVIPIEVQGGKYKLFTNLEFEPQQIESKYDSEHPTRFPLHMNLQWQVGSELIPLKVDYQMFAYLADLDDGRLVTSFDNERSVAFGSFVRRLSAMSNHGEITIVKFDGTEKKLKKTFGNVRLV